LIQTREENDWHSQHIQNLDNLSASAVCSAHVDADLCRTSMCMSGPRRSSFEEAAKELARNSGRAMDKLPDASEKQATARRLVQSGGALYRSVSANK
jgi:hypothetical protein